MSNFQLYNKYVREFETVKAITWSLFYWETNSLISFNKMKHGNKLTFYSLKLWFVSFELFCSSQINWHSYIKFKFTLPFKSKS